MRCSSCSQVWSKAYTGELPMVHSKYKPSIKIILHRIISVVYILSFTLKRNIVQAMMMSYMVVSWAWEDSRDQLRCLLYRWSHRSPSTWLLWDMPLSEWYLYLLYMSTMYFQMFEESIISTCMCPRPHCVEVRNINIKCRGLSSSHTITYKHFNPSSWQKIIWNK